MTREEAIDQLQDAKDGYKEYLSNEAIDIAIKALEQESTTKNDLEVDCISRKAALGACHNFAIGVLDDYYEKCLKQWIIDLPSITPQESVIDKIRVEIKAMFPPSGSWIYEEGHEVEHTVCEVLADVLQILDKYKAESEIGDGKV